MRNNTLQDFESEKVDFMDKNTNSKPIERTTNEVNLSADLIKMRQSWPSMNPGGTEAQWNVT